MRLFLRKLILQMHMPSHPVELDVWFFIGPFVYFHTSCVWTVKALARLCGCVFIFGIHILPTLCSDTEEICTALTFDLCHGQCYTALCGAIFHTPPQKSGGVLCYTLSTSLSVRPSALRFRTLTWVVFDRVCSDFAWTLISGRSGLGLQMG